MQIATKYTPNLQEKPMFPCPSRRSWQPGKLAVCKSISLLYLLQKLSKCGPGTPGLCFPSWSQNYFYNPMKILFFIVFRMHGTVLQASHEEPDYNRANESTEVRILLSSIKLGIKKMCSHVNQCNYSHKTCHILQNKVIFHVICAKCKEFAVDFKNTNCANSLRPSALISKSVECWQL